MKTNNQIMIEISNKLAKHQTPDEIPQSLMDDIWTTTGFSRDRILTLWNQARNQPKPQPSNVLEGGA